MTDRTSFRGRSGGPAGRGPREDRAAEAPFGAAGASAPDAVDPELFEDLGAEFPLRGDQLEGDLEAAQAEAAEWRDKALRAQAEFENTRKRLEARQADALLRASERVVQELFPVLDDLERAIEHAAAGGGEIAGGLTAVYRKLLDVIGKEGCVAIDPAGEAFDPERHHAVQMREDGAVEDTTVLEVFQKGYEMHGRVLRPAMVVVSTGGAPRRG